MCPNWKPEILARGICENGCDEFKNRATPPFSCICTPHYYYDRNLLNRPDSGLF